MFAARLEASLGCDIGAVAAKQTERGQKRGFRVCERCRREISQHQTNATDGWTAIPADASGPASDVIFTSICRSNQSATGNRRWILGVNLIYASVHHLDSPEGFLACVFEDLSLETCGDRPGKSEGSGIEPGTSANCRHRL